MILKYLETIMGIDSAKYTFDVKEGQYITAWVDLYTNQKPVKPEEIEKNIDNKYFVSSFINKVNFKYNEPVSIFIKLI